ncbi:MAG: inositol 2-dehydrogenase, partial [Gammaproteobacteria bacterium]|nr:inositol 2-dehydrogenase [Gammaproteobacteria bacterium]
SRGLLCAENIKEHMVTSATQQGVITAKPMHFFLERYELAYRAELHAFVNALNGESVILPTLRDGLQALLLAEAAMQSIEQGRSIALGNS